MTLTTIVVLLGVLTAAGLWPVRKSSPAGVLAYAVPASLAPLFAAIAVGAWFFRSGLEEIGRTGHGGVSTVADLARAWTQALMTGCFATTALLVLAGALAIGARRHGSAIAQERRFPTAGFVLAVGATLAMAVAFLFAADRGAMGTLTRMAGVLNIAPPPGYHAVNTLATADWFAALERDLGLAAFGGTALGLASLAWVMFAGRRIDRLAGHLSIARTLAVFAGVASVGSVWFATHFHAASAWLRGLER